MKALTLEEAIKALEEGKTLQFYDDGEWLDSGCRKKYSQLKKNIRNGFIYRIKPTEEEKEVLHIGDDSGVLKIGSEHQCTPLIATNSKNQEFAKINSKYFDLPKKEKEVFLITLIKWALKQLEN